MIDKRILAAGFAAGVLIGTISIIAASRSSEAPNASPTMDAATQTALQDGAFRRALQLIASHNYSGAIEIIRPQALAGRADAQGELASMYWYGDGLPVNHVEAIRWSERAASQGNIASSKALAGVFARGDGVPEDPVAARTWMFQAAMAGDRDSQAFVGAMFIEGYGGAADEQQGVFWLTKAAQRGDSRAGAVLQEIADKQLALSILQSRMSRARSYAGQLPTDEGSDPAGAMLQSIWSRPKSSPVSVALDDSGATNGAQEPHPIYSSGLPQDAAESANDVRSGRSLAPVGGGAFIDPQDGTYYSRAGPDTVVNSRTGEASPVSH